MVDPLTLLSGWATRRALDSTWRRITAWFRKELPRKVLIIGPGGVGKTTLAHFLSGPPDKRAAPFASYDESISVERYTLGDDPNVDVIGPPGQPHRMDATWKGILDELKKGSFRGVILILAYGYHALGDISYVNHRLYDGQRGVSEFVMAYLADRRKEEERVLKLLCEEIRQCNRPMWMMTLVTKQDLWWDERDTVKEYYESGRYLRFISNCVGSKTTDQFRHESVYVSLVLRNLTTGRNELLSRTVAGYDQPLQAQSIEKLLQVFEGLMEWEEQHG